MTTTTTTIAVGHLMKLTEIADDLRVLTAASSCSKLHFAAAVVDVGPDMPAAEQYAEHSAIVRGFGVNTRHPALAYLCEGECVREKMESRTRPYVGACLHAEERAIATASALFGFAPATKRQSWVQVVGTKPDGSLVYLPDTWTCVRCATAVLNAGLAGFIRCGRFPGGWKFTFIRAEDAIRQAMFLNFQLEGDPRA